MNLLDRVQNVRLRLSSKQGWEGLSEAQRSRMILNLLDQDGELNPNCFVYDIFLKSHHQVVGQGTYVNLDFTYEELMLIFDLMEKYAKLWIFS